MMGGNDHEREDGVTAEHPAEAPETRDDACSGPQTITGTFKRVRRGPAVRFQKAEEPVAVEPAPAELRPAEPRPARVAIMLALAHKLQRLLDGRLVASQAEVAKMLGVTPARVTQILDLALLATDIQESVLALRVPPGPEPVTERHLRQILTSPTWQEQRAAWAEVRPAA